MKNLLMIVMVTLVGVEASAQTQNYTCYSYESENNDQKYEMSLTIDGDQAKADIKGEMWDDIGGTLSTKYKSKGAIKFVKFGYDLVVEEALLSGGRELNNGSLGGFARAEGEVEGGFYQIKFICTK